MGACVAKESDTLFCNPKDWPARLLCPWDSPGKNTGVGSHSLLQGIFPIQGSNPDLLHCRRILYHLSQAEKPNRCLHVHIITRIVCA